MNMGRSCLPCTALPIAIRLRDREGRAVLCIALSPQSGDSSGAILGVRSVALLHLIFDTFCYLYRRSRIPMIIAMTIVVIAIQIGKM